MTEKQEEILAAALKLINEHGYHGTSTQKIAIEAGVSEGLIFKHFKNKAGLLQAIADLGEIKFNQLYQDILEESSPVEVIRNTILIPTQINQEDYPFWKLQYKLKWEIPGFQQNKLAPLKAILVNAFTDLKYEEPELEAELILLYLDGFGSAILKGMVKDLKPMTDFLIKKYYI